MPDIAQATSTRMQIRESGKIVGAQEAVRLIRGGDTIATGGFVGIGFAEEIAVASPRTAAGSSGAGSAPFRVG